jgi:hypothetical protein
MNDASFRLDPNVISCGDTVELRAEWAPSELIGQRLELRLLEVDEDGSDGEVVAAFAATLQSDPDQPGALRFADALRLDVAADVEGDMQLPAAAAEVSRDGATTVPGTETTWQRAHVKLKLAGHDEEHVVLVRVAESKDSSLREGGAFELGLAVLRSEGGEVFRSQAQISVLDCWRALAENCAEAAKNQFEVHQHLVTTRGYGDHYGSQSSESSKKGKRVTDCVSYAVQVLERAYAELRANADFRYLHTTKNVTMGGETRAYKRYHMGGLFAPALHELGWSLVLCVADPDDLKQWGGYMWTVYRKAKAKVDAGQEPLLFGKPCLLVAGHGSATPEATASAHYDALKEEVPFGVVALSLGDHVAMKVGAEVYECHWSSDSTDANLFDREGMSWDTLRDESIFWLAAPTYAVNAAVERVAGESAGEDTGDSPGEGAPAEGTP